MGDLQPTADHTVGELFGSFDGTTIDAELFVRSLAPFGTYQTQERLVDGIDRLREAGVLDSLSIRVWGDAVRTDGAVSRAGDGETVVDRITEFFAHAANSACSVSRYFRVVSDGDLSPGPSGRRIVPPHRCLSLRIDGELLAVFPCDRGDVRYKPEDAVAYLERDHPSVLTTPSVRD